MRRRLWLILAPAALIGCGAAVSNQPDPGVQVAWDACTGVEPWQRHSACLRDQYRRQGPPTAPAAVSGEDAAAALLLSGGAFLSGWNSARYSQRPMVTCYGGGSITQCY